MMLQSAVSDYRKAFTGLSASIWWLSLVMLVNRSGTMVIPFMTVYMTLHFGAGVSEAAFVMTLFGAGSILGALLGGKAADRFGYFYVQLAALTGGGLLFILLGFMRSYAGVCAVAFLLSLVNEAFRPANAVAVAQYSREENRTRSYSLNRLAVNLGWAVGGALGGFLASRSYSLLFWVDGCTNLAAALLLFFVLRPTRKKAAVQEAPKATEQARSVYADKPYLFFVFLQVFFAICFFQLFTILPVYFKTVLHLSEAFIGITMSLNGLIITFFEMVIVFRLEGKRPPLFYIIPGVLLVGVSYAVFNIPWLSAITLALLSTVIISFGEILSMPFMNTFWVKRTVAGNRGQYAGLFTSSWSVAQIVGPLAGGLIAEKAGYPVLWWAIAGVCVLLAIGYAWLKRKV
jgi:predicted MFS family arabinose efflux permease